MGIGEQGPFNNKARSTSHASSVLHYPIYLSNSYILEFAETLRIFLPKVHNQYLLSVVRITTSRIYTFSKSLLFSLIIRAESNTHDTNTLFLPRTTIPHYQNLVETVRSNGQSNNRTSTGDWLWASPIFNLNPCCCVKYTVGLKLKRLKKTSSQVPSYSSKNGIGHPWVEKTCHLPWRLLQYCILWPLKNWVHHLQCS